MDFLHWLVVTTLVAIPGIGLLAYRAEMKRDEKAAEAARLNEQIRRGS